MSTTTLQTNATQKFQKTVGGSIKSLFSPGSRTYFVLEHKTNTDKHSAGESANFMTDYVEIGRGDKYAVNFGNDCKIVSRPHTAIARKQNDWVIVPLSQTNPTILNGQPVNRETVLSNGDEIQLANGGPKMSFLIPANPKVSGLNFTIRMKAAMNEAIRPYRTMIGTISLVFLLAVSGLAYFLWDSNKHLDSLQQKIQLATTKNESLTKLVDSLKIEFKKPKPVPVTPPAIVPPTESLSDLYPYIYYISSDKIESSYNGQTKVWDIAISGTGFLLNDGSFVTARHVVEPWYFIQSLETKQDTIMLLLNVIASNGGTVTQYFTATTFDGRRISFNSNDFKVNRGSDILKESTLSSGEIYKFTAPTLNDGTDWAMNKVENTSKGLAYDQSLSQGLTQSTSLEILGYPFGIKSKNPKYNTCYVSQGGTDNGMIDISNIGIEHGNSGGPVFAKNKGGVHVVVGIVSTARSNQGAVVPINNIY